MPAQFKLEISGFIWTHSSIRDFIASGATVIICSFLCWFTMNGTKIYRFQFFVFAFFVRFLFINFYFFKCTIWIMNYCPLFKRITEMSYLSRFPWNCQNNNHRLSKTFLHLIHTLSIRFICFSTILLDSIPFH